MLRSQQKLIRYGLINPKIRHEPTLYRNDNELNFYPVVGLKQIKLGSLSLNKPNNRNLLNLECVDELYRFLLSYGYDHSVENIWIEHRGKIFSSGADYNQLKRHQEYLDKLYQFFILAAQTNKPIIAKVDGAVRGIAAYLLNIFTVGLGTKHSSLRFDETEKGFVPICGGSHRLSRLPFSIGVYLALTGKKLDADEMGRLGFLDGMCQFWTPNKQIRKNLSEANLYFRNPLDYNAFDPDPNQIHTQIDIWKKKEQLGFATQFEQLTIYRQKRNTMTKMAMNQYKMKMVDYANTINPYNTFSEKTHNIINYYQLRTQIPMNYLRKNQLYTLCDNDSTSIFTLPVAEISAIFAKNTLKEILDALRQKKTEWSQETLKRIQERDPLASLLTFSLIKKAKNLSWGQCLEKEYKVARKLINQSELQMIENFKGSQYVFRNKFSNKKIEEISKQQIEKYFINNEIRFIHEIPKYSLLPTVDYSHIPDSPRTYLNRQFFQDAHLFNHETQVKRYLGSKKIDYRSKTYDVDLLRKKIYQDEELNKIIDSEGARLEYYLRNKKIRNSFKGQRVQYINNFFQEKQSKVLYTIKGIIRDIFNKKLQNRFKSLQSTAEIAGKQAKLQIFRRLKKSLVKNVILNGSEIEAQRLQQYPIYEGVINFDQKGRGMFDSKSSIIQQNKKLKVIRDHIKQENGKAQLKLSEKMKTKLNKQKFPDNLGAEKKYEDEIKEQKLFDKLLFKYGYDARLKQKVKFFKQMILIVGKTSEELEKLTQLTKEDIQTRLINEERQLTFGQFAKDIVQSQNKRQQYKVKKAKEISNERNILFKNLRFQKSNIVDSLQQTAKYPFIFDSIFIPQPFRQQFLPLLNEVLGHFTNRYQFNNQKQFPRLSKLGLLDKWYNSAISLDFTTFIRSDVQFVFSYLAIIEMRQILISIQQLGGIEKHQKKVQQFMRDKFGLNFKSNNYRIINGQFMKFFYLMLDIHAKSKNHILLPQSKLLDFINRMKIKGESERKRSSVSFESWVLLLAKDRRRILQRIQNTQSKLGLEPQYTMSMLDNDLPEQLDVMLDDYFEDEQIDRDSQALALNAYKQSEVKHRHEKSLLINFHYYMYEYDKIISNVAGRQNFINQQLRDNRSWKNIQILKQAINLAQSPQSWFKGTLKAYLEAVFQYRQSVEKNMTKGELIMFDRGLNEILESDELKTAMEYLLTLQINNCQKQFCNKLAFQKQQNLQTRTQETYLLLMNKVKNLGALKRYNNLFMTQDIHSSYQGQSHGKDQQLSTKLADINFAKSVEQVDIDIEKQQRQFVLPQSSQRRIIHQIFSYPQAETPQSQTFIKSKLSFEKDDQQQQYSNFLSEYKQLRKVFTTEKLVDQLQHSIYKIERSKNK